MDRIRIGFFSGVLLALGLAGGTGCLHKTSGTEVIGVMNAPGDPEGLSRAILVHNLEFGRTIQVVDVSHDYAGDLLTANVVLGSSKQGTRSFQYKFSWFNDQGVEVLPNTDAWTPVTLHGRQTVSVLGVAPNADAKSFKVNLRN